MHAFCISGGCTSGEKSHQQFDKFAGAMHWDGTTDISNVPLENVLLVNPRGPYFHSAVDSKGGNVRI
jgi:hypothetical protein